MPSVSIDVIPVQVESTPADGCKPVGPEPALMKVGSGLDFIGLGQPEDYKKTVENPDLWHPTKAFEVVVEYGN